MTKVGVIGVGNAFRSDDAVGTVVIDELQKRCDSASLPSVRLKRSTGEVAELLDCLADCHEAVIIDAMNCGEEFQPGDLVRFDLHSDSLPAERMRASTHSLGVAEALELARALGCLPDRVIVWGVVGQDFSIGSGLTPKVAAAADSLTDKVWRDYLT